MRISRLLLVAVLPLLLLGACAKKPGQNQYTYNEVGKSKLVEFATVVSAREVGITGKSTGTGGLLGAGIGGGAGAYAGNGSGQIWTTVGGALIGAAAGSVAEQAAADGKGVEYVVTTESGKTLSLIQNLEPEDAILQPGQRVMVQTSGSYQRVLAADSLPTEIKRPKGIVVTD